MSMDLSEQYEKIYRYCYFKIRQREIAEDITQETFLRFFESNTYINCGKSLHYLYTIARNLCTDEYRKPKTEPLGDDMVDTVSDNQMVTQISVRIALSKLDASDRELLLLRYVNEVPVSVICKLYNISRFAAYRRISKAAKNFKNILGKEDCL